MNNMSISSHHISATRNLVALDEEIEKLNELNL